MVRRMMWLSVAALATQAALAQPPGGGMGGMGGGRPPGGMGGMGGMDRSSREPNMKFPSAKTLQDYNPASLLLDKHKKLKLTDAQQTQLKDLRLAIFERNVGLLARYDSLQREYTPPKLGGWPGGCPDGAGGPPGGGPPGGGGLGGRGGARGGGRGGGEAGQGGQTGQGGDASDPVADSTRRAAMRQMMQLRQLADSLEVRRRADLHDVLNALSSDSQKKTAAKYLDKQDLEFSKKFPSLPAPRGDRAPRAEVKTSVLRR